MGIEITANVEETLTDLVRLAVDSRSAMRDAGRDAAQATQSEVRRILSSKTAYEKGVLRDSITFRELGLPVINEPTPVAQTYADMVVAPYANIIEYGWAEEGTSAKLAVKGSDIREWWLAVKGREPPAEVLLNPTHGRGVGYHMFEDAVPYAEQSYYQNASIKISEVISND